MSTILTHKSTQAVSIPRLINTIEAVSQGNSTTQKISEFVGVHTTRINYYVVLASDLGFVNIFGKNDYRISLEGRKFIISSNQEKAEILHKKILEINDI